MSRKLLIDEFDYQLPEESIAQFPLEKRDASKLLVYRNGQILHDGFQNISNYLSCDDLLVFNDTKVIPARLFFQKPTGSTIQVFLLEPVEPYTQMERALESSESLSWNCIIGNLKKWKEGEELELEIDTELKLKAILTDREKRTVRFSWQEDISFSEVLKLIGNLPLPPYINRAPQHSDEERYQTVYASHQGAVAAPTAGLHFSEPILDELKAKNIEIRQLTLHVGAGTFQPVKTEDVREHPMHEETFIISRELLEGLITSKRIVATGTTSLRALESMYWMGLKIYSDDNSSPENLFRIGQFEYENIPATLDYREALTAVLHYFDQHDIERIEAHTAIMICPGYKVRSAHAIITNFHLPKSTLIMLISSLVGDKWKKIYSEALEKDYRFLSYGDSSLLFF